MTASHDPHRVIERRSPTVTFPWSQGLEAADAVVDRPLRNVGTVGQRFEGVRATGMQMKLRGHSGIGGLRA